MNITYALEPALTAQEFHDVLVASTLAERRPANDMARLDKMLRQADIIVTARDGEKLVGIARSVTDFAYCCYLSDLAVDETYQHKGIGKQLIAETQKAAGPQSSVILIAAPKAEGYYPRIGMQHVPACWVFPRVS